MRIKKEGFLAPRCNKLISVNGWKCRKCCKSHSGNLQHLLALIPEPTSPELHCPLPVAAAVSEFRLRCL